MIQIIGGKGFVGSRLVEEISEFQVLDKRIIDNLKQKNFAFVDIRIPESLKGYISREDAVVLLAAEHRDDITPISKYYETNVQGTQNVLDEMDRVGCKHLIFTSSVAVYGLNKINPDERHPINPFNHYGKSKWEAEKLIKTWYDKNPEGKSVTIIRPTVIFGEKNRGNVYQLLKQIASGKFVMIGKGQNKKSMAYVGNVVAFIKYRLEMVEDGYHVFNYIDKPDLTMASLIKFIQKSSNKNNSSLSVPVWFGYLGGYCFDILAFLTGKKLGISSVRVRKFIATTQFDASKVHSGDFIAPYSLEEGLDRTLSYEFIQKRSKEDEIFYTE